MIDLSKYTAESVLSRDKPGTAQFENEVISQLGYNPMKEMRINKLELMLQIMSKGETKDFTKENGRPISEPDKRYFFENVVPNIKPLLFKMAEGALRNRKMEEGEFSELGIDLPFKTFSIEPGDDWHSVYSSDSEYGLISANMVVIDEVAPDFLEIYSVCNFLPHDGQKILPFAYVEKREFRFKKEDPLYETLALYLSFLDNRTAEVGYSCRAKVKAGNKKDVIKHKATAIYIDTEKKYTQEKFGKYDLEWKFSWEVRGHWRRFDGVGKNRIGIRNIEGWTWVKAHKKGQGELVSKKRVVK